jgi:hypothetical protein
MVHLASRSRRKQAYNKWWAVSVVAGHTVGNLIYAYLFRYARKDVAYRLGQQLRIGIS